MKERLQQTYSYQGGRVRGRWGKDDLDGVPAIDACALKAETGNARASWSRPVSARFAQEVGGQTDDV